MTAVGWGNDGGMGHQRGESVSRWKRGESRVIGWGAVRERKRSAGGLGRLIHSNEKHTRGDVEVFAGIC